MLQLQAQRLHTPSEVNTSRLQHCVVSSWGPCDKLSRLFLTSDLWPLQAVLLPLQLQWRSEHLQSGFGLREQQFQSVRLILAAARDPLSHRLNSVNPN